MKRLFVGIVFGLLIFFAAPQVSAFNVSISPAKTFLELAPGTSEVFNIKIRNNSDEAAVYRISSMDYVYGEGSTQMFIEEEDLVDPTQSITRWLNIQELVEVGPQSSEDVLIHLKVPPEATFGDHFGAIFFQVNQGEGGGPVEVQGKIASLVLLQVIGGEAPPKAGNISYVDVRSRDRARNTVTFEIDFLNTSNSLFSAEAIFEVFERENDPEPIKVLKSSHQMFPNVVRNVRVALGDLGDNYGEGQYIVRMVLREKLSEKEVRDGVIPQVFYDVTRPFEYFVPLDRQLEMELHQAAAGLDDVDRSAEMTSVWTVAAIRELVLTVGAVLIVLIVLIRILFFQRQDSRSRKS